MPRHCSVPEICGFREWFEKKFGDLCAAHDAAYKDPYVACRRKIDCILAGNIFCRGYPVLAIATYIFVRGVGWTYWHYNP